MFLYSGLLIRNSFFYAQFYLLTGFDLGPFLLYCGKPNTHNMYESIIPSVDAIPVHWLWFELLLILTFFIHMVLMNFLLGGTLLSVWDLLLGKPVKKASGALPTLVALTVNFGVPPLLFVQVLYGHLFYSSSVMVAVPWILVIPILILAYYAAYIFVRKAESAPGWSKGALVITSLFLLYIAFIFVNNNTLAIRARTLGNLLR